MCLGATLKHWLAPKGWLTPGENKIIIIIFDTIQCTIQCILNAILLVHNKPIKHKLYQGANTAKIEKQL